MATGKLGSVDIPAAANTTLYTVTAGLVSSFNLAFCNRGNEMAKVRVSIGASDPLPKDYIVYDHLIPPGGEYERTGLVASSGEVVVVRSDKAGMSARAYGFEEAPL
ncbi:hypothetical protein [Agrobacterium tumefaciens]|uniref:hypothetical protein n=1 Tax=Agrobacterium tumefaciens TaxID=358 RepID=UPI0015741D29|nr:hypothetical protein [Agrobacterium tumefaciens]